MHYRSKAGHEKPPPTTKNQTMLTTDAKVVNTNKPIVTTILAESVTTGKVKRGVNMTDTTPNDYSNTDADESRDHGTDIERHKRGVLNIKDAYSWAAANDGPGGALGFVLKKLSHALESGRRESLRCLLDTISVNREFTDHDGNTTTAGHNISGALARIIAYVRPDLVTAIELRPSSLLDAIDISEVLSERELRIFE